jgi:hypothetical protein
VHALDLIRQPEPSLDAERLVLTARNDRPDSLDKSWTVIVEGTRPMLQIPLPVLRSR